MHKKTVIFDLDGTLLDTLEDLAYAGNRMLAACGFPEHPVEKYRYFVGDGMRMLVTRIIPPHCTSQKIDHCCTVFSRIYGESWARSTTLYPGIEAMLERLGEAGVRLAILSNKPHQFTTACVDRFFPHYAFDLVFGQRDHVKKKPDPAGALEIAEKLAVQPADCVYVGDTAVDMQTGKGAGMFTIGVLWGFRTLEELQGNDADLIVHHPMEIVEHVIFSG